MRSNRRLKVLLVEPFHGGSHRAFAEGLARHSAHRIDLLTFPPEMWKWRLRSAALAAAERISRRRPDVLLLSSLLDGGHLLSLLGPGAPPAVVYFHESQLGYPRPQGKGTDVHLGIVNLVTALSARRVLFNSRFHRDDFLGRLPGFLGRLPPPHPRRAVRAIRSRSRVLMPGVELHPLRRLAPLETRR